MNPEVLKKNVKIAMDGVANPVYQDPAKFWRITFATEGHKVMLKELIGRFYASKHTNSPVVRLETAFGGGKT